MVKGHPLNFRMCRDLHISLHRRGHHCDPDFKSFCYVYRGKHGIPQRKFQCVAFIKNLNAKVLVHGDVFPQLLSATKCYAQRSVTTIKPRFGQRPSEIWI